MPHHATSVSSAVSVCCLEHGGFFIFFKRLRHERVQALQTQCKLKHMNLLFNIFLLNITEFSIHPYDGVKWWLNMARGETSWQSTYFWEPFLHLTSINICTLKHFHLWRRAERPTQSRIQLLNRSVIFFGDFNVKKAGYKHFLLLQSRESSLPSDVLFGTEGSLKRLCS